MINKSVIVTGASKGIGAATAYLLAKNKFNVAIIYKSSDKEAKKVLTKCNNYSNCILIKADVTNDKDCKKIVKETEKKLIDIYGQNSVEDAEFIVPIGGDGLLLRSLHSFNKLNKPFFGINFGSIGFLMNNITNEDLSEIISTSKKFTFKPLKMSAFGLDNQVFEAFAYNEVSIMRQTHLASKIKIKINDQIKIKELICDLSLINI